MTQHFDADVAIVGYGPTGVTAALTLAKHGVRVVAFERDSAIYPRARAVTVNDWTMRIFQSLGIDERITRVIEPQRALRWVTYDGTEIMRVEHPPSALGATRRFYNIYQPVMEAELRACAAEYGDLIDVRYGAEVTGLEQDADGVTVTAADPTTGETRTVRARYVIGADGGGSGTRAMIGSELLGDTLDVQWIVIDCRVKRWWPDRDLLTFWSDGQRPVVDIALSVNNHRWEIPLKPDETEADFASENDVWPLLKAMGVSTDDVSIHQWAFYRHHTRMAGTWRAGRIFLAGDAAHLMPPWAGPGCRPACGTPTTWAGSSPASSRANSARTGSTPTRPSGDRTRPSHGARRPARPRHQAGGDPGGDRGDEPIPADTVTPFEPPLIAPPVLDAGWIRGPVGDASSVGRMVPQPIAGDTTGRMARLDDLLGDGFVLLGADVDPAALLTPEERAEWDALGTRYVAIRPKTAYTQGPDELVDLDEVLLPWLARYGARAVAVRPDRFVAAADVSGLAVPA